MDALKVPVNHVLVVVDDLAIPFGSVKMRPKGSDAGHNGLKNINALLGHSNYPRLRFGIGDNFPKGRQVDYVLSSFDDDEQKEMPALIAKSIEMIKSFVSIGTELTMTKYN
jgi:PTH1 family peptidyl-tRNA hydrolase